jgi:hypothetical protein
MGGRHRRRRRLSRRGRRVVVAGGLAVLVLAGAGAYAALRDPGVVIPDDPCAERPPLRTVDGVTLQPLAMTAFRKAQTEAGVHIDVVQSYRSCAQQRVACKGICGDPNGCAGTCAPPGKSWHQLGAAVDITQASLDDERIRSALEDNGWCQSVPDTDPGHFSYGGCH